MVDPTATTADTLDPPATDTAKGHFAKAMDEAKAGAQALAEEYRAKFSQTTSTLGDDVKTRSDETKAKADAFASDAMAKAGAYAQEGKAQTSKAIVRLSKVLDDNVGYIDDKAGARYGDYARSASKSMQDAAAKLDEKSFQELGEDVRSYIRTNPAKAVGMGIFAGYVLGRLFGKSK